MPNQGGVGDPQFQLAASPPTTLIPKGYKLPSIALSRGRRVLDIWHQLTELNFPQSTYLCGLDPPSTTTSCLTTPARSAYHATSQTHTFHFTQTPQNTTTAMASKASTCCGKSAECVCGMSIFHSDPSSSLSSFSHRTSDPPPTSGGERSILLSRQRSYLRLSL